MVYDPAVGILLAHLFERAAAHLCGFRRSLTGHLRPPAIQPVRLIDERLAGPVIPDVHRSEHDPPCERHAPDAWRAIVG
jgi:hypothetical protein